MSTSLIDRGGRLRFAGRLVREARVADGLTATALHARITAGGYRMSLAALTRIERGGGTRPDTARAIADALGRDLTDFVIPTRGRGVRR